MNRIALIFCCHNSEYIPHYNIIKNAIAAINIIDIYLVNPNWAKLYEKYEELWFKTEDAPFNTKDIDTKLYVGNCFFITANFKDEHPDYDYYVFQEYDINFTGDWKFFYEAISKTLLSADYLIYQDFHKVHDEWWWNKYNNGVSADTAVMMYYQFYGMSAKAIDYVIANYHKYYGHHEYVISNILATSPLIKATIQDIDIFNQVIDTFPRFDLVLTQNMLYHPYIRYNYANEYNKQMPITKEYGIELKKLLHKHKPKYMLDLGLGTSTIVFYDYILEHQNAKVYSVDNNKDYVDNFLMANKNIDERVHILLFDSVRNEKFKIHDNSSAYLNLESYVKEHNLLFDFVSVDGPFGFDCVHPRVNIIYMLHNRLLNTNATIIMDDTERTGEQNTLNDVLSLVNGNVYTITTPNGKDFTVIEKISYKF